MLLTLDIKSEFSHLLNNVSWCSFMTKSHKMGVSQLLSLVVLPSTSCGVNPIENSLPNILRAGRQKNKTEIEQKMRFLRLRRRINAFSDLNLQ